MFHALQLACSADYAPGDAQANSLPARLLVANARTHENKLDVVRGGVYTNEFPEITQGIWNMSFSSFLNCRC